MAHVQSEPTQQSPTRSTAHASAALTTATPAHQMETASAAVLQLILGSLVESDASLSQDTTRVTKRSHLSVHLAVPSASQRRIVPAAIRCSPFTTGHARPTVPPTTLYQPLLTPTPVRISCPTFTLVLLS